MTRLFNIDFLRFLSALGIVYFHLMHKNLLRATPTSHFYHALSAANASAYLLVEFFLIVSGFFMFYTYLKKSNQSLMSYSLQRFFRLWPVMVACVILLSVVNHTWANEAVAQITLTLCTGLSDSCSSIIWFVAPLFWCGIFLYAILKYARSLAIPIILILLVASITMTQIFSAQTLDNMNMINSFISFPMLRVMMGMSLGIFVGYLYSRIHTSCVSKNDKIAWGVLEFLCCALLFYHMFIGAIFKSDIICMFLFAAIVLLFSIKHGWFSNLLNKSWLGYLGKYSYSIYVVQQASFDILDKIFWSSTHYPRSMPVLSLIVSILFTVLLGILMYYIIERPAMRIGQRLLRRH